MSFDQDPDDKPRRILCYHSESDCLFFARSWAHLRSISQGEPVDDVTGVNWAEERFKKEQETPKQK